MQEYVKQYYVLEAHLPRFLSAAHSMCVDTEDRKILLENINDEEGTGTSHQELLLKFSEGLGIKHEDVINATLLQETEDMIDTFFSLSFSSYASALGALFAYEFQASEIAESKILGLKKFYNIQGDMLEFFEVHIQADKWHSEQFITLLKRLDQDELEDAMESCKAALSVLNVFLDGMMKVHQQEKVLVH